MIGIECDRPETATRACAAALSRGVILLPSGDDGRVLSITPPLCIGRDALTAALTVVVECIQ
jgi:4-aminobutyrate aminotransferase-like enzyme